jgi:hypothetical protein
MSKLLLSLFLLPSLGYSGGASAYDSGEQSLGNVVGATDYYKITCSSGAGSSADHLNLTLADTTPNTASVQILNLHLSKKNLGAADSSATPGRTRELSLQGGNGKYQVAIDTVGTDAALKGKQNYALIFQCVNAANESTKTSSSGKSGLVRNGKRKSYSIKCSTHRTTGATDKLLIKLSNTTASGQILNAQLVHERAAKNLTDGNQIDIRDASAANGNGPYFLTVDNTGTDAAQDNSKRYTFQTQCMTSGNEVTAEPVVEQLQDQ